MYTFPFTCIYIQTRAFPETSCDFRLLFGKGNTYHISPKEMEKRDD